MGGVACVKLCLAETQSIVSGLQSQFDLARTIDDANNYAIYRGYELLQERASSEVPVVFSPAQQQLVNSYSDYAASLVTPPSLLDRVGNLFDSGDRWMADRSWVSLRGYDSSSVFSPGNVFNAAHNVLATVVNLVPQGLSAMGEFAHWTGLDTLPPVSGVGLLGMTDDLAIAGSMLFVSRARGVESVTANNLNVKNLAGFADNEAGLAGSSMRTVEPGKFSSQIKLNLSSTEPGLILEGQVGRALDEKGLLLNYQSKIRSGFTSDGRPIGIGEIDAETSNYIIEIASGAKPGKLDQLAKLQNNTLLNPDRKPVLLFAPKLTKPQQIKAYENTGVKVINNFDQLFELKL